MIQEEQARKLLSGIIKDPKRIKFLQSAEIFDILDLIEYDIKCIEQTYKEEKGWSGSAEIYIPGLSYNPPIEELFPDFKILKMIEMKVNDFPDQFSELSKRLESLFTKLETFDVIRAEEAKPEQATIIDKNHLELILKRFKEWFPDEKNEIWVQRFSLFPSEIKIDPIKIGTKVNNKNDRLILIIILSAIQNSKKSNFDYDSFVFNRFGIKNYQKAKTDHKEKIEKSEELKICNKILTT